MEKIPQSTLPRSSVTLIGNTATLLNEVREKMEQRLKTRLSSAQIFTILMRDYLEQVD